MSEAICTARFNKHGARCERPVGHSGMHQADHGTTRWGGRYKPADLNGKPGAIRDADKDNAARRKRPRGPRCSVCCQKAELEGGRCKDRIACAERQPYLSGSELTK